MVLYAVIWLMSQAPQGVAGSSYVDRLAAEGRSAEAAAEVEQSLAADPRAALRAGILRAQAGHDAHAWRHLEQFLKGTDVRAADREAGMQQQARLATREIAVLLDVTMNATVVGRRLDEQLPPLEWPVVDGKATVRVDQHDWELTVMAPGHAPQRRAVGGQEVVHLLSFTMEPLGPAEGPAEGPAAAVRPKKLPGEVVAGAVVLPIGVVALGGVVAMLPGYVRSRNAFDGLEQELAGRPATLADRDELRGLRADAQHKEAVLAGFGVTAAVAVVVGAILVGQGRRYRPARQLHLEARPGAAVIGLSGRF